MTLLDRPFARGDGAHSFHLLDSAGNKAQSIYHPAVSATLQQRRVVMPSAKRCRQ